MLNTDGTIDHCVEVSGPYGIKHAFLFFGVCFENSVCKGQSMSLLGTPGSGKTGQLKPLFLHKNLFRWWINSMWIFEPRA